MSPSTVMQLKLWVTAILSARFNTAMVIVKLAVVLFVIVVGSFYVNPDPDCGFSNLERDRNFFSAGIGSHDRLGDLSRVRCRSCNARCARSNPALDIFHRHRHADATGGANENVFWSDLRGKT